MTTPGKGAAEHQLAAYGAEAAAELTRILTFWQEQAPDSLHGGFIGQMKSDGSIPPDSPKGAVLNARILWTFSAAYRHTQQEAHRQMAERAFNYLLDYFLDKKHGGIFWEVDAQGQPLNTRKQIYALAFAIYGLSEFYRSTREEKALEVSQELYGWIEKHSFHPEEGGYWEAFDWKGGQLQDLRLSEKDRNHPKTMNTHLHVLEAYANLYRIWPDRQLAGQLEALIRLFLDRIIDPATGHLQLFFTPNWTPTADLVSFGHDIEASWLLQEAAEVLSNRALLEEVKTVAKTMAGAATEGLQPDGSLFHEFDRTENRYDTHREWWVSAEAMVGFLNAYALTEEEHYLDKSLRSWEFAKQHLLDREQGEWRWGIHHDYRPMATEDKIGFWKCPYHNARACLEVVIRCRQLNTRLNLKTPE
jgi:cellobiose epimerase